MSSRTKNSRQNTYDTDQWVTHINQRIDQLLEEGKAVDDDFFCNLATTLSKLNIKHHNGGPFGALIVEYEGGLDENGYGIGKPYVVGVGANHVFPNSDPSAHAEMEAYRDAARRKESSDLSQTVLFTSCECCPMCLACANGSGVGRIAYVNDRNQAAKIGFADELQYELSKLPREEQMTHLDDLADKEKQADYVRKLGRHGAVILDNEGEVYATGDEDTRFDPTGIASINAVRNACKKAGDFCLPENFTIVTRDIPHPAGLVAADWARLLRDRTISGNDPENPSHDSDSPNPLKIIHLSDKYEQMPVFDRDGNKRICQQAELTYRQPSLPNNERAIPTRRHQAQESSHVGQAVFDKWLAGITGGEQKRY